MFSLTEADEAFRESDKSQAAFNSDQPGDTRVWIVSYEIIYFEAEEMKMVAGTAFISEGHGGILENLQKEVEEHLNSQTWLDYKKAQVAESFKLLAELHDTQEHCRLICNSTLVWKKEAALIFWKKEQKKFHPERKAKLSYRQNLQKKKR